MKFSDTYSPTLRDPHIAALTMLRETGFASVPSSLCHPRALVKLREMELIEASDIPGCWSLTPGARNLDFEAMREPERTFAGYPPYDPEPEDQKTLLTALRAVDHSRPGDEIFGKPLRSSTLDLLLGKSLVRKYVYLAYPEGFALKHIAWALRESGLRPLWTDHNVGCVRYEMGLPAMRKRAPLPRTLTAQDRDPELYAQLLDSGSEPWEIEEYFAVRNDGRVMK